jgi:hypothetical protein
LFADQSKTLTVSDPDGRELAISCGAALQFARLAARNLGHVGTIRLLPDPANPDLLAGLRLGGGTSPTAAEERRFKAITERHTNRTAFDTKVIPALDVERLSLLASVYGIRFAATSDEEVHERAASLVAEADLAQMSDAAHRRELARWVRPGRVAEGEGMSLSSFGASDRMTSVASAALKMLDLGAGTASTHERLVISSPWIGLIASTEDDVRSWLRTGMALADILLEITAEGLDCSFANQPIEVAEIRPKLGAVMGIQGFPQMLLRVGKGVPVPPSARLEPRHVIGT